MASISIPPIGLPDDLNNIPSPTPNYWESEFSRPNTEEDDMASPSMHMAGSALHAIRKGTKEKC